MNAEFEYDSTHPHYTPSWLSERLAAYMPSNYRGLVVDPACGAGNLLAAVALGRKSRRRNSSGMKFLGIDVSRKATAACRAAMSRIVDSEIVSVITGDFLKARPPAGLSGPRVVVMNPPFRGYGLLSEEIRSLIGSTLGMSGKFNLSHAFVVKVIRDYKPDLLVSVLPSNWFFSAASTFRAQLENEGGSWIWEDVGDAFTGVAANVGILIWRPGRSAESTKGDLKVSENVVAGFDVRQGVATGRDDTFRALAELKFKGGSICRGVVGKDIGRQGGVLIWVPKKMGVRQERLLIERLPQSLHKSLSGRACVKQGRRSVVQYHENFPSWFLGDPKLLLPEVLSGMMRVELDESGDKLPLHSTLAIRLPSAFFGNELREHLLSPLELARFRDTCPRLAGGAIRLNVSAVRSSVSRWWELRSKNAT